MQPNDTAVADSLQPIGIDLGTTFSVVAYVDQTGRPTTIINETGDLLTPSAVAFDADSIVVGKEAVKSAVFEPTAYAECFKRDMGRREFHRPIAGTFVPPEVLSGFVLRRLKLDAERHFGGPVRQAVITVPAFFDESRRRSTQEAGRLAGLEVLDIINEPTAAAIAFGYYRRGLKTPNDQSRPERLLVYDLGGGTFDVTVLEIDGQTYRTLATDGDVKLGGRDFDERLLNHVAERMLTAHRIDPRSEPHDAAQLWSQVQQAKHTLSQRTATFIPCVHAGVRMRIDLTRDDFEQLTADLLDRTETTTQLVLRQSQLTWSDIDRVLLVGGATRMPMVGRMLSRLTGKELDRSLSPDEAVAHGAALYARLLSAMPGTDEANAFRLINVNSHSLGIIGIDQRAKCSRNVVLIPKNSPLPCRAVRKFATARENQGSVKVQVVEGESERPEHCIPIGECVVRNLPPGLPKGTKVEVEYKYSANGRLSVQARVPAARQSAATEIQYDRALHIPDLDTWYLRLTGATSDLSSEPIPESTEDVDQLMQRLDELLIAYGLKAATLQLPASFASLKTAALSAVAEVKRCAAQLVSAERQRQSAVGQTETMHTSSALTKASIAAEQAETDLNAAYRRLARECVAAEYAPASLDGIYHEIKRLTAAQ